MGNRPTIGDAAMMSSLKGQYLVAMPGMQDERFQETVIYLVAHGEEGAMGLVVNKRMPDLTFGDILEELNLGEPEELIRLPDRVRDLQVLRGGPVESGRGFVLHTPDYFRKGNSYAVDDAVCLTATIDILKALAHGEGPKKSLLALGYCGWSPGQLEGELQANGWLTVEAGEDLLFGVPVEERYDTALGELGVNRAFLSSEGGSA